MTLTSSTSFMSLGLKGKAVCALSPGLFSMHTV
jgi:hypothetical protein